MVIHGTTFSLEAYLSAGNYGATDRNCVANAIYIDTIAFITARKGLSLDSWRQAPILQSKTLLRWQDF